MGAGNLGKEKSGCWEERCCMGQCDWPSGEEKSFHLEVKEHAGPQEMASKPREADNLEEKRGMKMKKKMR